MALIYIVEDDVNIRERESFALKNSGYTIEDFSQGYGTRFRIWSCWTSCFPMRTGLKL